VEPQRENEVYIAGKRVLFRARVPLSKAADLPVLIDAMQKDLRAVARIGVLLVEEWEFEGLPTDRKAYEELDVTTEILPLAMALGQYIARRTDFAGGKA
jgi:hypothetical protein